jgi:oligopeptide transport system substrate-binding protein
MNKAWKQGFAVVASVSALGLLLAGCGASGGGNNGAATPGANAASSKPQMGGNISVDLTQAVPDLDPAVAFDTTSAEVDEQLYEPLVTYQKNTYNIVGNLAQSYEVSTDGLTYTFHIRKGVTYWNGDPLKAQDFASEIGRVLNQKLQPKPSPGSSFFLDIQGAQEFFDGKATTISGVSTPDDQTLVIKLVKPQAFFLQVLAMPFISAVDPKFATKVGNAALDTSQAMGTGPFELVSNGQDKVVLKKNTHYWKKDQDGNQLPYLNQVTFNVNNNDQVDSMHWEQGTTAIMTPWTAGGDGIPTSAFPTIMHNPKFSQLVQKQPMNSVFYIGLNSSKTLNGKPNPVSNPLVRQAMEYAFNDAQIVQLHNNAVLPLNQPLPKGMPGYVNQLDTDAQYSFDINKAKALLKQAGYANGLTLDFYDQNIPDAIKDDQAIQSMMQQAGIKLNLHETTWKDFLSKVMAGTDQTFICAWQQDFPDASDFLNTLFNSNQRPQNNLTMYDNPQVDNWLNQAQYLTNQTQRNDLYGKVINQTMKDAAWIPMYQMQGYYGVQSWVHGFYTSPVMYDPFQYMWIDQSHSSN